MPHTSSTEGAQHSRAHVLGREVAHPVEGGVLRRRGVAELGQRLGRADADAGGDAGPARNGGAHVLAHGPEVARAEPGQAQEGLVDGVDFQARREVGDHRVHAAAHVAVQSVVRRENPDAVPGDQPAQREGRRAHLDAERLGLGRARDGAPVVVGQHQHRHALQPPVEDPLARDVETRIRRRMAAWTASSAFNSRSGGNRHPCATG
jgi:hypothetical protein